MNSPTLAVNPFESTHRQTNPGIVTQPCSQPAWSAISAALGELDDRDEDRADIREKTSSVLRAVLAYLTQPADVRSGDWHKAAGRRVVGLRLALDPDAFGKSISLRTLDKTMGLGRSDLCRLAQQARAEFGLRPVTNGKETNE